MDVLFPLITSKWRFYAFVLAAICLNLPQSIALASKQDIPRIGIRRFGSLTMTPDALHFRNVVAGQTYLLHVTVSNSGRSTLAFSQVYRSSPVFSLSNVSLPLKVAPGKKVAIEIAFTPRRSGSFSTDFIFTSGGSSRLVLHTDGTSVARGLVPNPQKLDFGNVSVGGREHHPITLVNSGSTHQTLLNVTVLGSEFNLTGVDTPLTLSPGQSFTFDASFAPDRAASFGGTIIVDTNGSYLAIALAGKGSQTGQVVIAPASLNFGNVSVGTTSTLTGTLQAGRTPITIYSAGITSREFSLSGLSFPFTIAARRTKSYQVTFYPNSSGGTSAGISFQSSAAGSYVRQTLLGTGIAKRTHSVNLSWNPEGTGAVAYNVYRASVSGGPYSRINPAPDSNPSYLDTTILSGQTYYYVTTALAANGKQSTFSNQVEVIVP